MKLKNKGKKKQSYASNLVIPRGLGPVIPDASLVRLPFAYSQALFSHNTTAWMVGQVANVRVLNAFSPINATHQPYGWDQMAAMYRRYKVVGYKMSVKLVNVYTQPGYFLGRPVPVDENFTMLDTLLNTCVEKPNTTVVAVGANGAPPAEYRYTADIPKLLGITREQFLADTDRYGAAVTAAPTAYPYVQIGWAGPSASSYVQALIQIEYLVQFWQRVTLDQS